MNLADNRLRQLDDPALTPDARALLRCGGASDLIHRGQYEAAREALTGLWCGIGRRPNVEGLAEVTTAEVLLQCGALSSWLGSSKRAEGAQEAAKDLISEAQRLFEAHGLRTRIAEAEYELGICYWRAGALGEAQIILEQASGRLGEDDAEQKAKILIRSTLVFANHRTGVNFTSLRDGFMKACESTGIPYGLHTANGITLHSLRHTFATRLQDKNIQPYTIMALMGHSSAKMSAVYSHASPDTVEAAVARLEARGDVLEFAVRQKSAIGGSDGVGGGEATLASG